MRKEDKVVSNDFDTGMSIDLSESDDPVPTKYGADKGPPLFLA